MDLGIKGRKAIVCASSQGLGLACATSLAREGALVTINGRTADKLVAAAAEIVRGPRLIDSATPNPVGFGEALDALGPADASPDDPYTAVSLGDGGSATVTFASPIGDVPGPDFAVFENGFSAGFHELGHVEVSSDGVNFFRFPSTSLTPASANIGEGGSVNPTNVRNLAGKYLAGYGTPFDLTELRAFSPGLDIQRITHVRVIDVVGTNNPLYATRDSAGGIVIDPYPTNYFTGGFDLDAAKGSAFRLEGDDLAFLRSVGRCRRCFSGRRCFFAAACDRLCSDEKDGQQDQLLVKRHVHFPDEAVGLRESDVAAASSQACQSPEASSHSAQDAQVCARSSAPAARNTARRTGSIRSIGHLATKARSVIWSILA